MSTPLQSTNLTADDLNVSTVVDSEDVHAAGDEGHHIHLPNPSLWPFILTVAIILTGAGLLTWKQDSVPWLTIISAPFILVGIMGWALEDPMKPLHGEDHATAHAASSYEEATATGRLTRLAESVLQNAEDAVERVVTVGSIPWSAHPVQVEVEREGVILALYGKVELEAQRRAVEDAVLKLPGVIDVRNFIVAEDALLNAINATVANLKASGKLEGAKNISVLVENYIVNLYGEVPSVEMKLTLERALVDIPGVKVIVNRIGLSDTPGDLGKTRNKVGK